MTLDKKTIREGDQVWVSSAGCHAGDPFAHVYGGTVVAVGADGGIVYRTESGRVDSCPSWMGYTFTATEAESWHAAADDLQQLAHAILAKVDECRAKARGEVPA
jgi:hypothetical protein